MAVARPIPRPPPVTMATFPVRSSVMSRLFSDRIVEGAVTIHHTPYSELLLDPLSAISSLDLIEHADTQLELGSIIWRYKPTGFAVLHHFDESASTIGNNWRTGCLRLDTHQPERLVPGGRHQHSTGV